MQLFRTLRLRPALSRRRLTCTFHNGVARIFFWGGPIFRDLRRPTRFGGGGVVADIFRDRRKPGRFSGGGVVAGIFRDRRKPGTFSGGGG